MKKYVHIHVYIYICIFVFVDTRIHFRFSLFVAKCPDGRSRCLLIRTVKQRGKGRGYREVRHESPAIVPKAMRCKGKNCRKSRADTVRAE